MLFKTIYSFKQRIYESCLIYLTKKDKVWTPPFIFFFFFILVLCPLKIFYTYNREFFHKLFLFIYFSCSTIDLDLAFWKHIKLLVNLVKEFVRHSKITHLKTSFFFPERLKTGTSLIFNWEFMYSRMVIQIHMKTHFK